jgi:hypothetical protein
VVNVGAIEQRIQTLENEIHQTQATPSSRFELANLYLCVGKSKAAKEQYKVLKDIDPVLAAELTKLMIKHGVRSK